MQDAVIARREATKQLDATIVKRSHLESLLKITPFS
jgi:hypothetical protein